MTKAISVLILLCTLGSLVYVNYAAQDLKIAAFNIQIFGRAKVANKKAFETIVKIVQQYDLILIQEIRDVSQEAFQELVEEVNKGDVEYSWILSERLGRSPSKEQYAYLARDDVIALEEDYQYPDSEDKFERPPYCVKITSKHTGRHEFALIGVHVSPSAAVEEINALKDVHDTVRDLWGTENILIMGDLNADCTYVSKKKLDELHLRTSEFHWLISDDADTTLSDTHCAYDRFIMSGEQFFAAVVQGSAGIFRFDTEYSLTHEQAKDVSDHYPIEFSLQTSAVSGGQASGGAARSAGFTSVMLTTAAHWVSKWIIQKADREL